MSKVHVTYKYGIRENHVRLHDSNWMIHDEKLNLLLALFIGRLRFFSGLSIVQLSSMTNISVKDLRTIEKLNSEDETAIPRILTAMNISHEKFKSYLFQQKKMHFGEESSWSNFLNYLMKHQDIIKLMALNFIKHK